MAFGLTTVVQAVERTEILPVICQQGGAAKVCYSSAVPYRGRT